MEVFYICPLCFGKSSLPLQIHHIDGDEKNNEYDNLIALCKHCHAKSSPPCPPNLENYYKEQFLKNLKKGLMSKSSGHPPPEAIAAFDEFILNQPTYRIHDMFAAEGAGEGSHLHKGIDMVDFALQKFNLDNSQRAEALLKLIYLERKYGKQGYLNKAEKHLKEAKQSTQSRGIVLYEEGYIKHLKNNLPESLNVLEESEDKSTSKLMKAHIHIVRLGISLMTSQKSSSLNENDFFRHANLLQDRDLTLYQSSLECLIRKYFLEKKLDKAEKIIEQYEDINEAEGVSEEKTLPDYFRGRILLMEGDYENAKKKLENSLEKRIQFGSIEGLSEIRAFLGEAYEKCSQESEAKKQYKDGEDQGPLMANKMGYEMCREKLALKNH